MKNVYLNLVNTLSNYPKLATIGNKTITKTKSENFAFGTKLYATSGEINHLPNNVLQLKFIEEYYGKYKDDYYFQKSPFFKKITETVPFNGEKGVLITRADGKGLITETKVNADGIRQYKIEKQISKDGKNIDCTKYVYNNNGTKPTIISGWIKPIG